MIENLSINEIVNLLFVLVISASVAGFMAGLLGVGGGIIMVPALYYAFTVLDFDLSTRMHLSVGTSLAIIIPTSIISTITETPIDKNVAMTGEITLTGNVLAIGGLKEKLLAAHRAGIKKVLIPENNKKDLVEIPKNILKDIEVTTVKNLDEVLKVALTKELKSVEWIDVDSLSKQKEGTAPGISTN